MYIKVGIFECDNLTQLTICFTGAENKKITHSKLDPPTIFFQSTTIYAFYGQVQKAVSN